MKYNVILFDLDGTLLNTLEDLCDSVNYALSQMDFPTRTLEEVRTFLGNGVKNLMIKATPDGEDNPKFQETFSIFKEYYLTHNQIKTKPYEGIMDLLQSLHEAKMPMAIVTNKNQPSVDVLARDIFQGLIPIAVGDNGVRSRKPDAAPVNEALLQLGYDPNTCDKSRILYVGDSEVDAATAENAGVDCLLCSWGFRPISLLETLPHTEIVHSPDDILKFLNEN